MARQPCPQHNCTCNLPRQNDFVHNINAMRANATTAHRSMGTLPFKDHPLFYLRKYTIISAVIGVVLSSASTTDYYGGPSPIAFSIFLLLLSIFVCIVDLASHAQQKAKHPDTEPIWPTKILIFFDFVLAVSMFVTFWLCIGFLQSLMYYNSVFHLLEAYGALAVLVCSLLHVRAFWREVMARKKQAWLKELPKEPCGTCGYTETDEPASQPQQQQQQPVRGVRTPAQANVFPYAGPSAYFRQASVLTPERSESAMEEGLLIGSDFEGGYQTIDRDEGTTVEQPDSVVVSKGKVKGKKKAAKRSDSTSSDGQTVPSPADVV